MDRFTVGPPHIKGLIKKVRNSSYTKINAVLDILDNIPPRAEGRLLIENGQIHEITIIDNDPNGFIHMLEKGEKNPFNLAHSNSDRHSNDDYMSEFGCGLKEAGIYLGNTLQIVTRIFNAHEYEYYKIEFNFDKMMAHPDASSSYDPEIDLIEFAEYKQYNTYYDCGSVIKILGIGRDTDSLNLDELKECIAHTYSNQFPDKVLYFNDVVLQPEIDIYTSPICESRKKMTEIYFNMNNLVFKYNWDTATYYESSTGKKMNKTKPANITFNANDPQWIKLVLTSTSIYGTQFDPNPLPVLEERNKAYTLPKSSVYIYREGRCHGQIEGLGKDSNDGWLNHVTHVLSYTSKKINKFLGINSTKGKPTKRDNKLTNYLSLCIDAHNKKLNKRNFEPATIPPTTIPRTPIPPTPIPLPPIPPATIPPTPIPPTPIPSTSIPPTPIPSTSIPPNVYIERKQDPPILEQHSSPSLTPNLSTETSLDQCLVSSIDPTLNCEYNALRTVHVHQHIRGPLTVEMYTKMARYFYENDKHSDQYAVEIYNLYLKMSTNDR
jgi:hypothetical protein